jgi:hypothetical protein
VNAIVEREGTVYIGGDFSYVGPHTGSGVAISPESGAVDPVFPRVGGGDVLAVVADGLGGWFIGGDFTSVGDVPRGHLAHIRADGTLDPNWNSGANAPVEALAFSGSTVYAGGDFTVIGGKARRKIAALDAQTGEVTAWAPNVYGDSPAFGVSALAVSGSTVYVGGNFSRVGGRSRRDIAALDARTGKATAWNPNAQDRYVDWVHALAVSGSTVYVGGRFRRIGGAWRGDIAAIDARTGKATPWSAHASGSVEALAVSGSTIYAGGWFRRIGGESRKYIAALDAQTGRPTAWNPGANDSVRALAVSGSTVYAGGFFTVIGGADRNRIAALDARSAAPTAWNPGANSGVGALAVSGSAVYAGGFFSSAGGVSRNNVAALDAQTGHATPWNPDANYRVRALTVFGLDRVRRRQLQQHRR